MRQYVLRRLLQIVPVLLIVTFLVFALMWAIPGDPVRAFIGPGEALDARQIEVLRQEHHLDQPMVVRYVIWLVDALRGDLGRSTINNRLVAQEVGERALTSSPPGACACAGSVRGAVRAGTASAAYRGRRTQYWGRGVPIGS